MAVKSSTNSAAALPQRTAVRRSDLRAARSFSGRELVQSIFDRPDRGLSADRLQGPPSGFRPTAAKSGRGAGTGDGRSCAGTVRRVRPARWYAIVGIRASSLAHASASGCFAGTTSFSGSCEDGRRGAALLAAALGVSCFCPPSAPVCCDGSASRGRDPRSRSPSAGDLLTCFLRELSLLALSRSRAVASPRAKDTAASPQSSGLACRRRARSASLVALGGGPVDVLFEGARLAGSLTITRGRVSPRKGHRSVPSYP